MCAHFANSGISNGKAECRRSGVIGRIHDAIMAHVRRRLGDEQGVAGIEMALIMPLMLILLLGAVELFMASTASRRLTRVTNTVGDLITQVKGSLTTTQIDGYYQSAQYIMGQFDTGNLAMSVFVFKKDPSTQQPVLSWKYHKGSYTCVSQTPTLSQEQKESMKDGNNLVIAFGCYKYEIRLAKLLFTNTSINMMDEVVLRPRQQMQLECSDCPTS